MIREDAASNLRAGARCAAALLITLSCATAVRAQTPEPVLRLTEPQDWRSGGTVTVAAGATVRVRGVASHPGGVARVLIAGQEATLRPDPEFPDLVNFEAVITATQAGPVTIRLVPRTGDAFERRFPLALAPTAAAPQRTEPQRAQVPGNPWKSFRLRGVLYGLAAAGGVVLGMQEKTETSESCRQVSGGLDCFLVTETSVPNQTAGFAIAGAAIGGFILDALLTSRRARAAGAGGDDDESPAALQLQVPAAEVTLEHVRINWIRLRF